MKEVRKGKLPYFECEECKLLYREKSWAERCEEWCVKNKSCNLEIIRHSVKNEKILKKKIFSTFFFGKKTLTTPGI